MTQAKLGSSKLFRTAALTAAMLCAAVFGAANLGPAAAEPADDTISIELNKMEQTDKGCRPVLVINNPTDTAYSALKLDLVMFEGGVFSSRVALDLAPVNAQKRSVKLFELNGPACDKISEFLINDVMECKTKSGDVEGCLKLISVSSLTKTKLSK